MGRRVTLVAWGSRGDVTPLVSLGRGLADAGDDVTVLASRDFGGTVTDAGLRHAAFEISVRQAAESPVGRAWLGGHRTIVGEGRALQRVLRVFAGPLVDGLWDQTREADLVVSGILTADACASLAAARGQRHAVALLTPVLPSRHGPSTPTALRPDRTLAANAWAGQAVLTASYRLLRVPGDEVRARLGHRRSSPGWLHRQLTSVPVLLGASPRVVPPAGDQPTLHVTGYWPPYGWPSWSEAHDDIQERFAGARAAGRPVVYFGFGSMTTTDPRGTLDLLLSAADRAGVHAVIGPGWSGMANYLLPHEHVTVAEGLSHAWLFSHCDAVVHHGGAGTTGSAIRSGVPQVVVAHMGDQPYWARRVHALGVAAAPLRRTGLQPRRLARSVRHVVDGEHAQQRRRAAAALADTVRSETGVGHAVAALEG
ncbi:MAG TPA: glycosyltransferase [Ornithinimicrobium sp.]|uniref:glycosyltransferase n=1 Tax=Ornithinimicrobium sp. TaxID=1977084 RepID=UPI002B47EA81|nr:glycosyltransferase [Ornithinimicrobium sp.]HKJ11658.1 glycosyltransferase [Ornithinimicrobium sp.]